MRQRMLKRQLTDEFLLVPLMKVLIVDDDKADLDYHSRLIQGQGHNVLACSSYSRGAELAEHGEFDFVVIGQGGAAFEGRAVIERLRAYHPATPFVVFARSKQIRCYLEAMELGAIDYLEKPVHPAEMKRVLQSHFPPPPVAV